MTKRIISLILAFSLLFAVLPLGVLAQENAGSAFTDVSEADWFYDAVEECCLRGLMNGVSADRFDPSGKTTRAMLVTILWRQEGSPKGYENTFEDVSSDSWYADAVAWAAARNIVAGVGNHCFEPDGNITREQIAVILFRYVEKKGMDITERADLSSFPDSGNVSVWAKDAMQWAVAVGLISGSSENGTVYLLPQDDASRAQIATMLIRFVKGFSEPVSEEDAEAYRAYLELLEKNRESILAGQKYSHKEPVSLFDLNGDGTPELLFLSYDTEEYQGYFNIYTYADGRPSCLLREPSRHSDSESGNTLGIVAMFSAQDAVYMLREGGADTFVLQLEKYTGGQLSEPDEITARLISVYTQMPSGDYQYVSRYSVHGADSDEQGFVDAITGICKNAEKLLVAIHTSITYEADFIRALRSSADYIGKDYENAVAYLKRLLAIYDEQDDILKELANVSFVFASGIGAWSTRLEINADGTFDGFFMDTDMGGADGPCRYECSFSGRFRVAGKKDSFTYILKTDYLTVNGPKEEYVDEYGARIIPSIPYGMEIGDEYMLYLPGAEVASLPEMFIGWVSGLMGWQSYSIPVTLPNYGLYNTEGQYGFMGFEKPDDGWSAAYRDFILSGTYESYDGGGRGYDENLAFRSVSLHDIDRNGTPELLIDNGFNGRDLGCCYVFTLTGGTVLYCGNVGRYLKAGSKSYPGLFNSVWLSGFYMPEEYSAQYTEDTLLTYYTLENNRIVRREVAHLLTDSFGNKKTVVVTEDDGLYTESLRYDEMQAIPSTPMNIILNGGWDAFVSEYGKN